MKKTILILFLLLATNAHTKEFPQRYYYSIHGYGGIVNPVFHDVTNLEIKEGCMKFRHMGVNKIICGNFWVSGKSRKRGPTK